MQSVRLFPWTNSGGGGDRIGSIHSAGRLDLSHRNGRAAGKGGVERGEYKIRCITCLARLRYASLLSCPAGVSPPHVMVDRFKYMHAFARMAWDNCSILHDTGTCVLEEGERCRREFGSLPLKVAILGLSSLRFPEYSVLTSTIVYFYAIPSKN